ncbi:hypothetical protein ACQEU3_46360 [Spirillospora sp. CA-253888]
MEALDLRPAAHGRDVDQRWTLARIATVIPTMADRVRPKSSAGWHRPCASKTSGPEALACTAEVMRIEDVVERKTSGKGGVSFTRVYHRLRIRVHGAGRPAYETGTTAELSGEEELALTSELKGGHPKYHCWADPEDHERVQVRWSSPLG